MRKFQLPVLMSLLILFSYGCSIRQIAIQQLGPMLSEASPELQKERNWQQFKRATPASLQLSEVLLYNDPDNRDLHALLVKGYASYAYIVNDTEYLKDRLLEKEPSQHRQQAILYLSKALQYGFQYLQMAGIDYQAIQTQSKDDKLGKLFDQHLDADDPLDQETVFFTGTAWLLSANYQRDNMIMVSQITQAFGLINWVCDRKPNFQNGLCSTMQAVYHLARPPMMGGKPDLAQKLFQQAAKQYPNNYLIPVTYLEWYVVPRADEDLYNNLKKELQPKLRNWQKHAYVPGEASAAKKASMVDLFNAMAAERFATIVANEKEIF